MPAITWNCPSCGTVNPRRSGVCMACGGAEETAATRPVAEPEKPTIAVEIAASPPKVSKAPTRTTPASPTGARGILFESAAPSVTSGAATTAAILAVTTSAMPAPPAPPLSPAAPARVTPPRPTRPPVRRSVRSIRRTRKFAVGRLLGVGHVALFVYAISAFLTHPQWGVKLLNWVDKLTIKWGDPVTSAKAASWQDNHIISDGYTWLSHLPWGFSDNTYFVLAIACLIVRLRRALPGWLSLVVALPAAVYGLVAGIAEFPWLAIYWPLTALTFIVAGIVVVKTVGRY
jgi:hypothetical protein